MIRLDPNRRAEAIQAGWDAYAERLPGMRDEYLKAAEAWEAIAVCDEAQVVGVLLKRSGRIHIGIKPEWRGRWASRRVIREMLTHGKKTTMMDGEDDTFICRIGFVKQRGEYVFCG